jgi:glycosyltransferase involved in cell wall biosynthesis
MVICGAAADDNPSSWVAGGRVETRAVTFGVDATRSIPFEIVGMSNQMPYPSTTFSSLTGERLQRYLDVWSAHIAGAVSDFQPDLIHVHHLWLLVHVASQAAPGTPLVVSVHGTDLHRAHDAPHIRSIVAASLGRVGRFVALTREDVIRARGLYSLDEERFVVLGNGFNPSIFHPQEPTTERAPSVCEATALSSQPLVLFVGKFSEWKGIDYLIRAVGLIRRVSDLKPLLWIVGSGPEKIRESYSKMFRIEGLVGSAILLGQLTQIDVARAMNAAHVFVLPSFEEPFGLSLLEAIACGCRVIAADQCGPAEFVPLEMRKRGYATLIRGLSASQPPSDDAERYTRELADAIEFQLKQPTSLEIRRQIASTVCHLTWGRYGDKLFECYEELWS